MTAATLDPILDRLAEALSDSDDLESLVRPLLELLEAVTGLESTYLTTIDTANNVQRILFARNTREMTIPEGLAVPWGDTLCKRALDEGRAYTDDVDSCWGDSNAARELGIKTYLSEPVRVAAGELYGTLCAASASKVEVSPQKRRILVMFARMIARQIERERLLAKLQAENREFSQYALTDPLTGLPNRRALLGALTRALANAGRMGTLVHVAFVDLDGFKQINDSYGHDAGDRFLIAIAKALAGGIREGDFAARYGGDEFVVFGSSAADDPAAAREAIRQRLEGLTRGHFSIDALTLDYPGASVGVVTANPDEKNCSDVLARADAQMYEIKKSRQSGRRAAASH